MTTAVDVESALLTLFSPEGHANPYPIYDTLRAGAPVSFHSGLNVYFLTRYTDVETLLGGADFRTPDEEWADEHKPGWRDHPASVFMHTSLLYRNPPDHSRLRRLVSKAFTARRIEALRPHIEEDVQRVLDALEEAGKDGKVVDFQDIVSFPLPVSVIGDLVGVPKEDQGQWRWLVDDMAKLFDPVLDEETHAKADKACETIFAYFWELLAKRRAEPQDDLLSALIATRDGTDALTDDELVNLVTLIFGAGFETTTGMIGNGIHALLANPDQLDLLKADPSLAAGAVTEVIRYDGSAQMVLRIAGRDTRIADVGIPAGAIITGFLGAANRDPGRFEDPARFDIRRAANRPLTFGGGIHFCMGSAVAKVQGEILYNELFARFPGFRLAGEPRRRSVLAMRGFDHLPITL
ncbi:cytochrome P450 [Amycolatopsis sp. NPDC059657]|uniref:cytochrome P450 n=1 Tax=Amycolatopsis sp. NPDC059657 TaxID=3346899 RepID=UPI0036701C6B